MLLFIGARERWLEQAAASIARRWMIISIIRRNTYNSVRKLLINFVAFY
jgi:hypothetical protein